MTANRFVPLWFIWDIRVNKRYESLKIGFPKKWALTFNFFESFFSGINYEWCALVCALVFFCI